MAKKFISNIENSKTQWGENYDENNHYPGGENVKLGCFQRIAAATEAMARNYVQLIADRDLYKRWYEGASADIKRLERSNAALRGIIKRMKKEARNG